MLEESAATQPALIVTTGDTIQSYRNARAETEWQAAEQMWAPYKQIPLYLTPGNHDVWNPFSAALYRKYTGRELHYSFDYGPAHFTVLDNSEVDALTAEEMAFLESDLKAHAAQPLKFVLSHRPSWVLPVMMNSPDFELQRIAKQYGVQYVIAGHLHGLIESVLDGVTYISAPSAGGNLRSTKQYEDGWFYGYMQVDVSPAGTSIHVKELGAPFGKGRTTAISDWGKAGLVQRRSFSSALRIICRPVPPAAVRIDSGWNCTASMATHDAGPP